MLINTVLTKEGNYYMIEGVPWGWVFGALAGTVDQRLASHVYSAWFFPQLDRNELNTFFDLTKNGRVPHGSGHADVALSTEDIPYGMAIKIFNRTEHWVDLPQSLILQMGKHIIRSRDRDLLKKSWTKFTEMMDYLESAMVNDVPEGITTYDYMNYHPCFVYTAILHLATLRMMIRLGNLLKEQKDQAQEIESLIQKYEKQYEATKNSYIERLWKGEGYFKTCESHDTIFTSTLAGDWISRFVGFGPVVDFEKAKSHSQWQSKTLIDSHTSSKIKRKKTRPLVYREADLEGNERPLKVAFYNKYRVNNPWQSTVYQGIEAIYLDRVEKGLDLIKMIWEKGYYEGYPWNMDHWGMEGHIYMTHPGLWSVLHALSGVAYDSFEQTLSISPRKVGKEKSLELPAFFPDFWLWIEYSFQDQKLKIKVLKVHKKGLKIGNVKESKPNGESQVHNLPDPMEIKENEKITLKLEFNF